MKKIPLFLTLFLVIVLAACGVAERPDRVDVYVFNDCPIGSAVIHVTITSATNPAKVYLSNYAVDAGGAAAGVFVPRGSSYLITLLTDDGSFSRGPQLVTPVAGYNRFNFTRQVFKCAAPQPVGSGTYYYGNNCSVGDKNEPTTWHWIFAPVGTGGSTIEIVIPTGESRSGQIPLGTYLVADWTEDGRVNNAPTERVIDGQALQFNVNLCPDSPLLGNAPTQ